MKNHLVINKPDRVIRFIDTNVAGARKEVAMTACHHKMMIGSVAVLMTLKRKAR